MNLSIKSMLENTLLISTKNHGATITIIVIIAAIIWFSVMLEARVPTDMAAIPNSRKPNIVTITVGIFTVPKKLIITE